MSLPRATEPEALDLPELDKGDESDDVDVGVFELDIAPDGGESEGEASDTFEIAIQDLNDSGSNEPASDLDVGVAGLLGGLPELPDEPESDAAEPDGPSLDEHLESPLESDEPSTDAELGDDGLEPLPELVHEEGDGDAGPELERAVLPSAPEGQLPRGTQLDSTWLVKDQPCQALWTSGSELVLGVSDKLQFEGSKPRVIALPTGARVTSLVQLAEDTLVVATSRGLLERSSLGTWGVLSPPDALRGDAVDAVQLAGSLDGQTLWVRLASGLLLRRRLGVWERHEAGGRVSCITCDEQRVTLLVLSRQAALQISSDDGSSFREILLSESAAVVAAGSSVAACSRGSVLGLADTERGLCVSSDGGETFRMVTGAVNVTALALGDRAGVPTLFAALYRESQDRTEIIAVDAATAEASIVAELSGTRDDDAEETGRTQALSFQNGSLFCAGGYGVVRLRC